ncbi:uncharacterized protein LOC62_01G000593 [Vanrija pseudolonga]|uniref:Cytochrome b-c1 complex subunit 10 n=1 Tax=Vanrija pseudolonga TaxID=143232 RepID=A0AAF1BF79_9TREE|nr:hypothetical protein LOC62_01G000593 [Vanrija pseudolonga]
MTAFNLKVVPQPHLGRFSAAFFRPFGTSLIGWGIGTSAAVALFMGSVPIFQKDVLRKFPLLDKYFADNTPDSDKPF